MSRLGRVLGIGVLMLVARLGAQKGDVRLLYTLNNDVYSMDASGTQQQLTNDHIQKSMPLWSKTGDKIAFLKQIDPSKALSRVQSNKFIFDTSLV